MNRQVDRALRITVVGPALLMLASCGVTATHPATTSAGGTPAASPFSNVVFLGDSLTAGNENEALLDIFQQKGYPVLLARQASFAVTLPLIAAPGYPAELQLVRRSFPPVLQSETGITPGREDTTAQVTNLAVPGQTLHDLINAVPLPQATTETQYLTNLVLGYPTGANGSQLTQAVALKPSTVFLWIGANDALPAIADGSPSSMTPLATFSADFTQMLSTLKSRTSAHLFVANLPDFTLVPFLTEAPVLAEEIAQVTGQDAAAIQQQLGLANGDLVNQTAVQLINLELPAIRNGAAAATLPSSTVLTAAEVVQVQSTIDSYNQVIAQQTAAAGGTVVDLHQLFNSLKSGIAINGTTATLAFLGGIFSLDGVHPCDTGYALIANQFIAAANSTLNLSVPSVDVAVVAAADPLFGPIIKSQTGQLRRRASSHP